MATKRILTEEQRAKARIRQSRWRAANLEKERARGRKYSKEHRAQALAWDAIPENREKKNVTSRARYQRVKAITAPEELRAKWRQYYKDNQEAAKACRARYRAAHPDKLKAYQLANKDAIKRRNKEWAKANPIKAAAKTERWRKAHPGEAERYKKENPGVYRAIKLRYRALLASADGNHTAAELNGLFEKQGGRCVYCSVRLTKSHHADHIQPLSKGGTNWISNIQLLCAKCNVSKHAIDPVEYARRLGRLI